MRMPSRVREIKPRLDDLVPFGIEGCGAEVFTLHKTRAGTELVVEGEQDVLNLKLDRKKSLRHAHEWSALSYDPYINMALTFDISASVLGVIDSDGHFRTVPYKMPEGYKFQEGGADTYFDKGKCTTVAVNGFLKWNGDYILQRTYLDWEGRLPFKAEEIVVDNGGMVDFIPKDFIRMEDGNYVIMGVQKYKDDVYVVEGVMGETTLTYRRVVTLSSDDNVFKEAGAGAKTTGISEILVDGMSRFVVSQSDGKEFWFDAEEFETAEDGGTVKVNSNEKDVSVKGWFGDAASCKPRDLKLANKCKLAAKYESKMEPFDPEVDDFDKNSHMNTFDNEDDESEDGDKDTWSKMRSKWQHRFGEMGEGYVPNGNVQEKLNKMNDTLKQRREKLAGRYDQMR